MDILIALSHKLSLHFLSDPHFLSFRGEGTFSDWILSGNILNEGYFHTYDKIIKNI